MKKCFSVLFMLLFNLCVIKAQIAPEIYSYIPKQVIYNNGKVGKLDQTWAMQHGVYLRCYTDGRVEISEGPNIPMSWFSPGPIGGAMDYNLIGPQREVQYLDLIETQKDYDIYYWKKHGIYYLITKSGKYLSRYKKNEGFRVKYKIADTGMSGY